MRLNPIVSGFLVSVGLLSGYAITAAFLQDPASVRAPRTVAAQGGLQTEQLTPDVGGERSEEGPPRPQGASPPPSPVGRPEPPPEPPSDSATQPFAGPMGEVPPPSADTSDATAAGDPVAVEVATPQPLGVADVTARLVRPDARFIGIATTTPPTNPVALEAFEAATGVTPAVHLFSAGWDPGGFDPAPLEAAWNRGTLPVVAWEPWNYRAPYDLIGSRATQPEWRLSTIIAGDHDAVIDEWAEGIAAWGRPVAIRLAHEMNGFWYPWSERANGNAPGEYVAMWRHVHDRFQQAGATNVLWLWSPNATFIGAQPMAELYPGDDVVDWVGVVAYYGLGASPVGAVPTFDELFEESLAELAAITDKPIVLSEVAATDREGVRADWITAFMTEVAAHPSVSGFVWFEGTSSGQDWAIGHDPVAAAAFSGALEANPAGWITAATVDWGPVG